MRADFTITINQARKPMAVQVKIHNSLPALQRAAIKHSKIWRKDEVPELKEAAAVCQRFHLQNDPRVAIVRLAPPYLGIGFLSHEMAHAAVWMWEIENKFSKKVPLTCENDEWFCWVLGELVSKATAALYEKGVYP